MAATMTVTPHAVWSDPGIDGLDVSETEWRLNVDRYREFLVEATGISPADGLTSSDCYRIGWPGYRSALHSCSRPRYWAQYAMVYTSARSK